MPAPDRLRERYTVLGRTSGAVVVQAAGTALIETWCDEVCEMIRREAAPDGFTLRPRFSPGYGDFPLSWQTELFRILQVSRHTGIMLTGSLMMMPSKSVTALIGLSRSEEHCVPEGCEKCTRSADCAYRRLSL